MASTPPSLVDDIRKAVLDNGFFVTHDPSLEERIKQLDEDAVHLASAGGLRFPSLKSKPRRSVGGLDIAALVIAC
jgi:hypothetical protein